MKPRPKVGRASQTTPPLPLFMAHTWGVYVALVKKKQFNDVNFKKRSLWQKISAELAERMKDEPVLSWADQRENRWKNLLVLSFLLRRLLFFNSVAIHSPLRTFLHEFSEFGALSWPRTTAPLIYALESPAVQESMVIGENQNQTALLDRQTLSEPKPKQRQTCRRETRKNIDIRPGSNSTRVETPHVNTA